ncbi:MAG: PASTA domain-containing protein [Acidobacteriota bacterium]
MSARNQLVGKTLQRKFVDAGKIVLLAGILVTVALLSGIVGMRFAVRRTEVEVPPIIGLSLPEAEKSLLKSDLKLQISGKRYDEAVPEGAIISQHPVAGGRLKAKRDVQVMVSLGKRTNPVPNLIGSTLRVAQLTAAQYGYEIRYVSEMASEDIEEGRVFQQLPPPESSDVLSPEIDLLISRGSRDRYIMPDLTGQSLNQVQPFLEKAGLDLDRISYRFYGNVKKGTVVRQFPQSGYLLEANGSINLEVAR